MGVVQDAKNISENANVVKCEMVFVKYHESLSQKSLKNVGKNEFFLCLRCASLPHL